MKKILWVEDQAGYIFDAAGEIFTSALSASDVQEIQVQEEILLRKNLLKKKGIFIEADFCKACASLFKEKFDTIIFDINFPTQYMEKDKAVIEEARKLFVSAFADNEKEQAETRQIFDEILAKEDYSGLLLFYLTCLYYENRKGWDISDIGSKICFFTGNSITFDDFQQLLKQDFSNGCRLREGRRIREYIDAVKENFWFKDDGYEQIRRFIEKDPHLDILRDHIGEEAREKFLHVLSKKESTNPSDIAESLGTLRNLMENILSHLAKNLNAPPECWNTKNPNQIVLRNVIKWFNDYDKQNRKPLYRHSSNSILKNFLYDIQEIASDFGPHAKYQNNDGYKPTSDTVNALTYALKDIILWFGKICSQYR